MEEWCWISGILMIQGNSGNSVENWPSLFQTPAVWQRAPEWAWYSPWPGNSMENSGNSVENHWVCGSVQAHLEQCNWDIFIVRGWVHCASLSCKSLSGIGFKTLPRLEMEVVWRWHQPAPVGKVTLHGLGDTVGISHSLDSDPGVLFQAECCDPVEDGSWMCCLSCAPLHTCLGV